jgi:sodium/potassium-transporting ATPase subunit alpha
MVLFIQLTPKHYIDFPATAAAIAKQVGIFTCKNVDTIKAIDPLKDIKTIPQYNKEEPDVRSLLLTGSDILTLNDTMWEQVCQYEEIVFSRTSPEQKLFIVKELQKRDNIVAMTGKKCFSIDSILIISNKHTIFCR